MPLGAKAMTYTNIDFIFIWVSPPIDYKVSRIFQFSIDPIFETCVVQAHKNNVSPQGAHMLRHTGMCHPNGLLFHQKSLDMDPILVKKILWGSYFTKICEKMVKSAIFEAEKPLEMGLDLRTFRK